MECVDNNLYRLQYSFGFYQSVFNNNNTELKFNFQSISPGPVVTDTLTYVAKHIREKTKLNYEILSPEDIANAVTTSLATPPNVLVSVCRNFFFFLL